MTVPPAQNPLHATSIAIDGRVVLLIGASGSGKSDLALRLIDRGATLVSDDYTDITVCAGQLIAAPPATIAGKMEVRHLGIVDMPHVHNLPVALAISLDDKPERMPDRSQRLTIMGIDIPLLRLNALEASTSIKVEMALRSLPA
ncbi:MAG: HPr kinase/phosphatase C-terminal domain-containing protein [Sphingobium sp.]